MMSPRGVLAWLGAPEESERLLEEAIRRLGGSDALKHRLQRLRDALYGDSADESETD
jgi:hypothetical protein